MTRSLLLPTLVVINGCDAFIPSARITNLQTKNTRPFRHSLPSEKIASGQGVDPQEELGESAFLESNHLPDVTFPIETPPASQVISNNPTDSSRNLLLEQSDVNFPLETSSTPQSISIDPTRDILLESMSRSTPEDFFDSFEDDVAKHVESIFSQEDEEPIQFVESSSAANPSISSAGSNAAQHGDDFISDLTGSFTTSSLTNGTTMNEDVKAVLVASGEAAAAAEASIPQDLMEHLATEVSAPQTEIVNEILSASSVVGEPVTTTRIESPKVSKILKFAIPAIGVWLCGPLLSLIDTSAVGVLSGTAQQAALNPAVAVTDYAALLVAFMYTGATNLVAAAQESDRGTPDKPTTTKTLIGAMQLSTYVGAGLGAILFAFARPLLKAIIGNDGISPAVFAAAMKYVRIRALGMPAAAIIGSTQAACLGMQDIRSPLYVLAVAAVVNFFGDVFFVGNSHALIGGAAGAAWATVLSQYVGVALFVKWLVHKPKPTQPRVVNLSKAILEMTGKPTSEGGDRREQLRDSLRTFSLPTNPKGGSGRFIQKIFSGKPKKTVSTTTTTKEKSFTVRGFLADRFSFKDLVSIPSAETRKDFTPYLLPVTTTQVGRVSGYVAMSHVVASSLGTVSMAAQQVIVSLFYCLCPIADSLSLTAQSFLPAISEKDSSPERTSALRKTTMNFIKAGATFSVAMVGAVSMIPFLSGMFTSDPAVIKLVNSVVPLLLGFFGVHGIVCSTEGVLLGRKDLNFLGKMYGAYFAAVPYMMLRVKKAALTGSRAVDLASVWQVFLGYQLFRCVAWLVRALQLQRRAHRESSSTVFMP